eukprot:365650-Chlamydomonas_euryale.AAC.4
MAGGASCPISPSTLLPTPLHLSHLQLVDADGGAGDPSLATYRLHDDTQSMKVLEWGGCRTCRRPGKV